MTQPPADINRETFHNVQRYGARGDANTLDTAAFQAAIDICHEQGGGTVWVPAGQYVTGTIFFRDNITLHYYGCGAWGDEFVSDKSAKTLDAGTPCFRHIHISQINARNAKISAGFIYGLGEMPIEDISLSDISVSFTDGSEPRYPEMADGLEKMLQAGFFIRNTHHIRLDHVEVTNQIGMAFDLRDSTDVEINASGTPTPDHSAPIFRLQNLSDVFIHHCRAMGAGQFLHFEGSKHNFQHHLTLTGNVVTPDQIKFVDITDTAGHQ